MELNAGKHQQKTLIFLIQAVAGDLAQMTAISPSPPLLASSSSPTSSPSPSGTRVSPGSNKASPSPGTNVSPGTPSGLETPLYTFTLPDLTSYPGLDSMKDLGAQCQIVLI